jgi:hypothetical protein
MLFAYLTLDDLNRDLAARLAADAGVELRFPSFDVDAQFDAVLYDLDFLPRDYRARLLATLSARCPAKPIGVHSYNVSPHQRCLLRYRRVAVAERLCGELFGQVCQLARVARTRGPMLESEL